MVGRGEGGVSPPFPPHCKPDIGRGSSYGARSREGVQREGGEYFLSCFFYISHLVSLFPTQLGESQYIPRACSVRHFPFSTLPYLPPHAFLLVSSPKNFRVVVSVSTGTRCRFVVLVRGEEEGWVCDGGQGIGLSPPNTQH
eukprot:Hpha_TRINITY_DN16887_c2_g6::TRINITY_DN16887_c2_g6_i1::g.153441::m.153441